MSAHATLPEVAVFEFPALVERCMGESSAAIALLGMFRERLPRTLQEIEAAIGEPRDLEKAVSKVHTLKGNAGNLAADRLYRAAGNLEQALRQHQLQDLTWLFAAVQQETATFLHCLPADLDTLV